MKKFFILATSVLLLLASCAKEVSIPKAEGELQNVTFTATIAGNVATKAAVDGDGAAANVNRCVMEIYYGGNLFERKYALVTSNKATFSTQLVSNRTYTVAFWADCVADATNAEGLAEDQYYTTNANGGLQAIVIKDDYAGNNDARDAFFVCQECTPAQAGGNFDVTLTRPFAQVNVITTDADVVRKVSTLKPTSVKVNIKSAFTSFNAVTGNASTAADLTYTATVYNSEFEKRPSSDEKSVTLSMDYLFAATSKEIIDIDWKAGIGDFTPSDASYVSHSFTNIPYQRNYRTNIKGTLLTTNGKWNVTVDPEWETPDTNVLLVSATVDDIDGANTFVADNPGAAKYDITFSAEPNDSGTPGVDAGAHAILTTPLVERSVMNVTVETDTKTLYVGDYPDQNTVTSLTTATTYAATVNLTVPSGKKIGNLIINAPSKSVYLNGQLISSTGTLTNVEATTSAHTLIVEQGQKIGTLTVHQGGLEIHENTSADVSALVIAEDAHDSNPVKVRACEHLSQSVMDVIYKAGEHDYIDRPAWVEKANTTEAGAWDIVESVCMINETNRGYASLADAFAAVQAGQTILLLKNCEINERIDVACNVTLDCAEYSVTNNVSYDRCLCVNGCDFTIVADGGSFVIPESNTASYGFIKVPQNCANTSITIDGLTMSGTTDYAALIKTCESTNDVAITLKDVEATASDWIVYADETFGKITWDIEGGNFTSENICFSIADWCTDDVCFAKFKGVTAVADLGPIIELSYTPGEFSDCNFTVKNLKQEPDEWYSVAIAVSNGAVATINSGIYTSEKYNALQVYTTGGTFNINGGTFSGYTSAIKTYDYNTAAVNIAGGRFKGTLDLTHSGTTAAISGGVFSVLPSEDYLSSGKIFVSNPDPDTQDEYPYAVGSAPEQ